MLAFKKKKLFLFSHFFYLLPICFERFLSTVSFLLFQYSSFTNASFVASVMTKALKIFVAILNRTSFFQVMRDKSKHCMFQTIYNIY